MKRRKESAPWGDGKTDIPHGGEEDTAVVRESGNHGHGPFVGPRQGGFTAGRQTCEFRHLVHHALASSLSQARRCRRCLLHLCSLFSSFSACRLFRLHCSMLAIALARCSEATIFVSKASCNRRAVWPTYGAKGRDVYVHVDMRNGHQIWVWGCHVYSTYVDETCRLR
jgi:hypothetical protein